MSSKLRFFVSRLRRTYKHWSEAFELQKRFPSLHLSPGVHVVNPHLLTLGLRVRLQHNALLHCGGFSWSQGRGSIGIGDDGVISPGCVLYGAGGIRIGKRFDAGPGVMIFSSRTAFESDSAGHVLAPVTIGDDVVIFSGAIIGPGVVVGDGAVIGAGSVVLSDVPARTLSVGSPARVVRQL